MVFIKPKALTKQAFKAFGDVIEANDQAEHFAINDGYTERYHDLAEVDVNSSNGRALVNIFRTQPFALPLAIKMMERHPLSSQAFIPMGKHPYLVVVAPKGDFDESSIEVFLATNSQGVNYHAGTWHHYCLALEGVSDFIVVDRGDENSNESTNNCDVVTLDGSIVVEL